MLNVNKIIPYLAVGFVVSLMWTFLWAGMTVAIATPFVLLGLAVCLICFVWLGVILYIHMNAYKDQARQWKMSCLIELTKRYGLLVNAQDHTGKCINQMIHTVWDACIEKGLRSGPNDVAGELMMAMGISVLRERDIELPDQFSMIAVTVIEGKLGGEYIKLQWVCSHSKGDIKLCQVSERCLYTEKAGRKELLPDQIVRMLNRLIDRIPPDFVGPILAGVASDV